MTGTEPPQEEKKITLTNQQPTATTLVLHDNTTRTKPEPARPAE